MRTAATLALALGVLTTSQARAASFCVGDAASLATALATAEQNDESNEIRIRSGHYAAPADGWHIELQDALHGLSLLGGFDEVCHSQSFDASATQLDGGGSVRPLTIAIRVGDTIQPDVRIVVSGLTIENGNDAVVGGLKIGDTGHIFAGSILVERNIFRNNVSTTFRNEESAGALLAVTDGPTIDRQTYLIVRDNLFDGNIAIDAPAMTLFSDNAIAVTGNTFVRNQVTAPAATTQGFAIVASFTGTNTSYANNVFWLNGATGPSQAFDVHADFRTLLSHNDMQNIEGQAASADSELSVDPLFVDVAAGNFRLSAHSPLINAGSDTVLTGAGATDADGSARLQGAHVDIGAYEAPRTEAEIDFFRDGFD